MTCMWNRHSTTPSNRYLIRPVALDMLINANKTVPSATAY